jgi:MFS family permease
MQRPLVVAAGAFVCFGVFWGSWAVATTDVERYTGLSNAGLGLLLSGAIAAGGAAAAIAGQAMARSGPDRLLPVLLIPWGLLSIAASVVPGRFAFVAVFALAVASAGLVDMAMNTAATVALGGSPGGMVRFHALFNAGTLGGAALVAGFVSGSVSWRWTWLVTGCAALGIAVAARSPARSPDGRSATPDPGLMPTFQSQSVQSLAEPTLAPVNGSGSLFRSFIAIKEEGLVVLVLAFAATAVVEGGIDTWGVLYLRTRLATGVLLGAGAYAAGQAIAATTRASGANVMNRLGHRHGFILGSGLAAAGLVLEASFDSVPVAACALALAAGGISLCWPLTMARLASPRPGADADSPRSGAATDAASTTVLVGGFTAAGYMGWVLGPAVVGTLSDHEGLKAGLLLLGGIAAAASAALAALQRPPAAR